MNAAEHVRDGNYVTVVYFRLHRMHEMQTIVTDVRGVCLSVCRTAQLGFTVQKWLNGQDADWSEHSWGPWNIVLHGGPDPLQ